ncbi:MAG: DNA repair protein RecO [Treponema sp.]|nr:DNA repair protein RecO [Treponema sp.]
MTRTAAYTAIVLRCRASGEANSEVTLLTAEEGIIKATVFGGAKSKLRAHSAPYNSGKVWLYRDKAKDYAKLSDFDVRSWRAGLRELYDRTMAACAIADTVLSTHGGGGDWETALGMTAETLDTMENAGEELCGRLLIHFLWRWSRILGIQPNIETCADCGQIINNTPLYFNLQDGSALCDNCAPNVSAPSSRASALLRLNPGCRKWLLTVEPLESSQIYRYSMDNKSFNEAKSFVTSVLSGALGKRLASWEW